MLIKNISINGYYLINGDLGYVTDFDDEGYPLLKLIELKIFLLLLKHINGKYMIKIRILLLLLNRFH